jgi:N-acetylglucosamine kinase-like BadF-type ATPase
MSDPLLLGVDGGNSKTIALLARRDGTIVGAGRAGACDHYVEPRPGAAYDEIAKAIQGALEAADTEAASIERGVLSLAGADWPEDCEVYAREVSSRLGAAGQLTVVNDALGALRGGTSDGIGVAIVCGTGTAVGARAADGRIWNVSFWAEPSYRYSLARGAVEATIEAELGIGEPTVLQQLVPAATGHASVEELLRAMTLLGGTRPTLSRTAIALLDAAEQGDDTAHRVIREVGHAMVQMARTSARKAGLETPSPVVLAGGLFRHPSDRLQQVIADEMPESEIVMARFEPAVGALLMAFDEHGLEPDLEQLLDTIPPPELYTTIGVDTPTIWL